MEIQTLEPRLTRKQRAALRRAILLTIETAKKYKADAETQGEDAPALMRRWAGALGDVTELQRVLAPERYK